jgi:membrane protein required for colicin V production
MSNLPVSLLDIVVIGVILISAVLAMIRGFTREVLAIASWIGAAVLAYMFYPAALPPIKQYIGNENFALAAAVGGIFLVSLIIISLITVKISDFVLDSRIGAIDRTLGFVFGGVRGFLICVIGFIFFVQLIGEKALPDWAEKAKSRPFLQQAGETLIAALPQNLEEYLNKIMNKAKSGQTGEAPKPGVAPAQPGTPPAAPATPRQ